jgi:hypothetical protein
MQDDEPFTSSSFEPSGFFAWINTVVLGKKPAALQSIVSSEKPVATSHHSSKAPRKQTPRLAPNLQLVNTVQCNRGATQVICAIFLIELPPIRAYNS